MIDYNGRTEISVAGQIVEDGRVDNVDLTKHGILVSHDDVISVKQDTTENLSISLATIEDVVPGEYRITVLASETATVLFTGRTGSKLHCQDKCELTK